MMRLGTPKEQLGNQSCIHTIWSNSIRHAGTFINAFLNVLTAHAQDYARPDSNFNGSHWIHHLARRFNGEVNYARFMTYYYSTLTIKYHELNCN